MDEYKKRVQASALAGILDSNNYTRGFFKSLIPGTSATEDQDNPFDVYNSIRQDRMRDLIKKKKIKSVEIPYYDTESGQWTKKTVQASEARGTDRQEAAYRYIQHKARQLAAKNLGKDYWQVTEEEASPYYELIPVPQNGLTTGLVQQGLFDSAEDERFVNGLYDFLKATNNKHWYNPFKKAEAESFLSSDGFKSLSLEDQLDFLRKIVDNPAYKQNAGEDLDDYHIRLGAEAVRFGLDNQRRKDEEIAKKERDVKQKEIRKQIEETSSFLNTEINPESISIKSPDYKIPDYATHSNDSEYDPLDEATYYRSNAFLNKLRDELKAKTQTRNSPESANTTPSHIKYFI